MKYLNKQRAPHFAAMPNNPTIKQIDALVAEIAEPAANPMRGELRTLAEPLAIYLAGPHSDEAYDDVTLAVGKLINSDPPLPPEVVEALRVFRTVWYECPELA